MFKFIVIEAIRSLWGAKQRSLLALSGIMIGIGSVIAMVSIGTIVQNESLKQFKEMGMDILAVEKEHSSSRGKDQVSGIPLKDLLDIPEFCPDVGEVAPYTRQYGMLQYGGKSIQIPALGVTASFMSINKISLRQGRFISDWDEFMNYCVIGKKIYDIFIKNNVSEIIGSMIIFNERVFTVVGIANSMLDANMRPAEINAGIMIPFTTSMRFLKEHEFTALIARLRPGGNIYAAVPQIQQFFSLRTKNLNIRVITAEGLIRQMQKQYRLFTIFLGVLGSISLIVGGVGVMNVMLVSVSERKREIGIRRALGAQRSHIQLQFLIESVVLCIIGGMSGILLGIFACYLIVRFSNWGFLISKEAVVFGVAISCAVGIFFGLYPARQAAKLSPVEALRSG